MDTYLILVIVGSLIGLAAAALGLYALLKVPSPEEVGAARARRRPRSRRWLPGGILDGHRRTRRDRGHRRRLRRPPR